MLLRVNKIVRRNVQWLRAIYVAMRYGGKPVHQAALAVAGKLMFHVIFEVKPSTKPGSLWWQRMKHGCGKCPIYSLKRKTCGNPVDEMGCLCFMPIKAGMLEERCWARQQGLDMGWLA